MDLEITMLNKISEMGKVKNHMISLIVGYQTRNKIKKLIDIDNSMVVTRRKGWGEE